jgi:hypothetical protein
LTLRWPAAVLLALAFALTACSRERAATGSQPPLSIATGDYPMYGHAADFSWLAGRVEQHVACTYLRFGEPHAGPLGGQIALEATPEQLQQLRDGDTVVIKGGLLRLAYGTCGAPSYAVSTIEEH